jgi:hypothetical protein
VAACPCSASTISVQLSCDDQGRGIHARSGSPGNHLYVDPRSTWRRPSDRWLCCLPLYHVAGLEIVMRTVTRDRRRVQDASRSTAWPGRSSVMGDSDLARHHTARPPARGRLTSPAPRDPGGRWTGAARGAGGDRRDVAVVQTYGLTDRLQTTLPPGGATRRLEARPLLTTTCGSRTGRPVQACRAGCADEDGWLIGDLAESTTRASCSRTTGRDQRQNVARRGREVRRATRRRRRRRGRPRRCRVAGGSGAGRLRRRRGGGRGARQHCAKSSPPQGAEAIRVRLRAAPHLRASPGRALCRRALL